MRINSLNCPSQPPEASADVPMPSSMFTHDESTPGAAMTQEEQLIETQHDAKMPELPEDTGIEPSFGRKTIERPVQPPALTEGFEDRPGDGTTTKILASEIPDSDAISPFTSPMKEIRGHEFVGGGEEAGRPVGMAGDGATEVLAAVVEGEESEGKATTNWIGEATMIELPCVSEVPVFAKSRPDAKSIERNKGDVEIQQAAASKYGGLNVDCGSSTEEFAYLESPRSDEVDVVVAENSLPKEKESLLQTALQADVALSLEEVSTLQDTQPTNDLLSTKEVPRTEIPASDDDEDPIGEDTDTSTNIFELHTSNGSSAKYHDTFPTDLQVTKDKAESFLPPSSTDKAEPQINGDTNSAKPQHSEMVDKIAPNTEATDPFDVFVPVVEPLLPRISTDERISGSVDIDALEGIPVEGISSTLVGTPTTSVNLQYPIQADARNSSGAMDVDLPDVPVSTMEGVWSSEAPMPPIHHLGASIIVPSSTASAESPKIETNSSKFNEEKLPEIAASSSAITEHPYQQSLPAEETLASLMSSLPQNADDARTSEISSSPPKFKAGKYASAKLTVTPNASFEGTNGSQIKEAGSVITLKSPNKRKTSSTAPNESQGQTKRQSIPKKMADTANASLAALVESPNNDVLFQELKAMKIASIQARNVSLEAEIAARREKLEVVTQELENPAAETVKRHIKLLHDYNDIRDVGQGLVGMIADNRGVRIGELYDEFGVGLND